jgi:hypothetical protein
VSEECVVGEERMIRTVIESKDSNTSRMKFFKYRDGLFLDLYKVSN